MNRPAVPFTLPKRLGVVGIILAVIGLLLLSIVFGSWYTVDQGERGVKLRYGAVVGIAEPGLNFKIPFVDTVRQISVQNQAIVYERVEAYSKDQQPATLRISVSYRVPEASVEELYSQYGTIDKMVERLISRKVPDEVKNVFGRYTAISAIQDRTKFGMDVNEALKKAVTGPVVVDSVQIEEVIFSDAYEQSIEKRMMAEVEIQTKRQNLETERINAEITVTQAKARADSALAQAQAEAEAIRVRGIAEADAIKARGEALRQNTGIVALTQAEKWNGVLPTTMVPGGTVPFLNVRANTQGE
ncbi:MAG TPA: prohibitin family protein [Dokdonella sp.]|uniref:prohibitin family protein n=1 Tax=Dokdonella sp. TaxID=2291710 RepID=UPI0025B9FBC5|nr:prohibitin family protein [Dokdonella sp.]MBX3691905.1 prohibitin family protein [Dokdonella sp.]MCW5568926.1 prohibitin family protein [Dokdonella sp.]HNR90855.1 prohibitin family protein [Dokdonella sp.]